MWPTPLILAHICVLTPADSEQVNVSLQGLRVGNYRAAQRRVSSASGAQFTCFTSTKVQILTPAELRARPSNGNGVRVGYGESKAVELCPLLSCRRRRGALTYTSTNLHLY
jgi:hypothetical protein